MPSRIEIEVSSDEMVAQLAVVAGEPGDAELLRAVLKTAGVTFGVDESVLRSIELRVADPAYACKLVIARGRPMRPETHDACTLLVDVGLQAGHAQQDGSFDYRDRGLLTPVTRGQRVAHCEPDVVGFDGCTVTGRVIPFECVRSEEPLVFGEGLARRDDGDVIATRDGAARRLPNRAIDVSDHYVHKGDVDIHSGNLEMHGAVTIGGDVTAKFEVQANGDVEIGKSVLRGLVYAGGSALVHHGVVGGSGICAVMAEHDITAEHAQDAELRCGGTIHLRRSAIRASVHAGRIRVDGPVRGGALHAEHEIIVAAAGALMGGETELAVGVPLERPIRRRFEGKRSECHRLDRLGATLVSLGTHARADAAEETGGREAHLDGAHIDVLGKIHAGSTVAIGSHRLVLAQTESHRRYSLDPETGALRSDPLP